MAWNVEFHSACAEWFDELPEELQDEIFAHLQVLRVLGPRLGRPQVDTLKGSVFPNMKELRVQFRGDPWRILFAFDPERKAILLVGGNKGGDARWYKVNVPVADQRYRGHLEELKRNAKKEP